MNSKKAKREENVGAKPKSLFTIVIGGNIVSRGVTFENLLSMFFTRSVKNKFRQDTYIQRARMFGAREDYLKYFELTIPEELYLNWHDCFIFHRLSLESIKSEGQAPTWIYGNRVIPTGPTAIDRSTVHIDSGEMGFEIFEYENKKELEVILKVENPLEVIQKLKEKYGKEILPDFLIKYISHLAQTPLIKISGPTNVKTWKEVDKNRLIRKRGFISTSSSGFYDFDHHIQIVFHPDSKKARVYYKPTSRKIGFLKNLENNEKFKFKRERDELKLLEKETPRFEVLAGIRGSGITFEKIDEMNRRIIELKKLLGGNNKKTPKGLPKENPIKKIKENSREELLQKAKGVIQEVKEEQTAPK